MHLKRKRVISEKKLVQLLKRGNVKAFESIYEKYFHPIYYFCLKYLKDKNEAEEIVQSLFLKIWEKRQTLNQELNFSSFLFRIAINDICNHIKKKRYEIKYFDYLQGNAKDSHNSTFEQIICNDIDHHLEKLIDKLPPQRKRIFLMSRKDNLSYEEISTKLNLSVRTVENHIFRTLKYLRKHLVKEC